MATYNVHGGHSLVCRGASGLLDEVNEDRKVKNKVIELLRAEGHTVYDCTDDSGRTQGQNLSAIVRKCNAHKVDLDVSIHLNAGGGTGVEVENYNSNTAAISDRICVNISSALGIRNRGTKYMKDLYVLRNTNSPAILIECCFVDNATDKAAWNVDKCAEAIVAGILNKNITQTKKAKWVKDDTGWWYQNADGSYPKNDWMKISGTWYYFDGNGYAIRNSWRSINWKWYYFDDSCAMRTGWVYVDNDWYYLDDSGVMLTGWQNIDGYWYYLRTECEGNHQTGSAKIGRFEDGENEYYFASSGEVSGVPGCAMVKGWLKRDDKWYWYSKDKTCVPEGAMMKDHWIKDGGHWYYLKDDGTMACDETLIIGGKSYSFGSGGARN